MGLIALVVCLGGCAAGFGHLAEEVAEEAAPTTVEETLIELEEMENRERLRALAQDPAWGFVAERLGYGATEGASRYLATSASQERFAALAENVADVLMRRVALAVERNLGPALEQLSVRVVETVLAEALGPAARARVEAFARDVTRSVVSTLVATLGEELREQLILILQDPQLRAEAADLARMLALSSVRGAVEGYEEIRMEGEGTLPILGELQSLVEETRANARVGQVVVGLILAALGVVTLMQFVWVRRSIAYTKELRERSQWQERLLEAVVHGRREEGSEGADELTDRVSREVAASPERRARLRELLDTWAQAKA